MTMREKARSNGEQLTDGMTEILHAFDRLFSMYPGWPDESAEQVLFVDAFMDGLKQSVGAAFH
jgi:hypothetical protein